MSIQLLIADDHSLLRAGLRSLLSNEADIEIIAEAADGKETLRHCFELSPDVVLLDINMPEPDGLEVIKKIRETGLKIRVLVLTAYEDESLLREAIRSGASGYIIKRAVETELIDAIHAVQRGELYVHPAVTHALLGDLASPLVPEEIAAEQLTPRETEVLCLISEGYTNRQIADSLNLSIRTVEGHRANMMGKLNVRSRLELVRYARKHGLVT